MPDYFDGYEIVSQTKNFLITCVDDTDARQRAQYVSYTCEADLTRLEQIFSTNFQAGETHDYTVWVNVLTPPPNLTANGINYGYEQDESSRIVILGSYTPPVPVPSLFPPDPPLTGPNLNQIQQDYARYIFIAELAEILMGFTGYGWNAGQSHGEGLSEIAAALFYPEAYYGSGQGPRVNQWLNGIAAAPATATTPAVIAQPARKDWVLYTEGTDQNFVSFGCAILFINYLVYQLGISLQQVVRAGGSTLAETYAKLTGNSSAQAFPDFAGLIAKHCPADKPTFVAQDNIFPLRDPPDQRALFMHQGFPTVSNTTRDQGTEKFTIKPGIICPPGVYDFNIDRELVEASEYVRSFGYMNAVFSWSINGTSLPAVNVWDTIGVSVSFETRQPDGTTLTIPATTVLRYYVASSWNKSALFIRNTSTVGNCSLALAVSAREAAVPTEASIEAGDTLDLDIITFVPGAKLTQDRKHCNPVFYAIDNSIFATSRLLVNIKNRPDPPQERTILQVLAMAHRVEGVLAQAAHSTGLTRAQLLRELNIPGALFSRDPRVSETTLARIKAPVLTAAKK